MNPAAQKGEKNQNNQIQQTSRLVIVAFILIHMMFWNQQENQGEQNANESIVNIRNRPQHNNFVSFSVHTNQQYKNIHKRIHKKNG